MKGEMFPHIHVSIQPASTDLTTLIVGLWREATLTTLCPWRGYVLLYSRDAAVLEDVVSPRER